MVHPLQYKTLPSEFNLSMEYNFIVQRSQVIDKAYNNQTNDQQSALTCSFSPVKSIVHIYIRKYELYKSMFLLVNADL